MGNVYADITIRNYSDIVMAENGILPEKEVREVFVNTLVDTGAWTLVISEAIREKLGLKVIREEMATLADYSRVPVKIVNTVEVIWKDRQMTCQPIMMPGTNEVLLGAIPLENMDLIVDPKKQELTGRHGDIVLMRV